MVFDRSGIVWSHRMRCTIQVRCVHTSSESSGVDCTGHGNEHTAAASPGYFADYKKMTETNGVRRAYTAIQTQCVRAIPAKTAAYKSFKCSKSCTFKPKVKATTKTLKLSLIKFSNFRNPLLSSQKFIQPLKS